MIAAAFLMGIVGSIHCVGMCGPIALALPYGRFDKNKSRLARILFQTGRVSTYALLGLVLGFIGLSASIFGGQQFLSITIGIILIISIMLPSLFNRLQSIAFISKFQIAIKSKLAEMIKIDSLRAFYVSGLLNGLLPCGLVWLALSTSLALANGFESAVFMLFFGLGTIPSMILVLGTFQLLKNRFSFRFKMISNYVALTIAVLLIVRGLNMGNYLSPYVDFEHAKEKIITICGFD